MDLLKARLAGQVQQMVKDCDWSKVRNVGIVRSVEVKEGTDLETQIQVRLEQGGSRYFLVKVSEQYS